jgi:hypothetical protein
VSNAAPLGTLGPWVVKCPGVEELSQDYYQLLASGLELTRLKRGTAR